jgi:argininosuccinate synthase
VEGLAVLQPATGQNPVLARAFAMAHEKDFVVVSDHDDGNTSRGNDLSRFPLGPLL